MKKIFFLLIIGLSLHGNTQNGPTGSDANWGLQSAFFAIQNVGRVGTFINYTPTKIVGSYYVLEKWRNRAFIVVGDKKYQINNINFNAKTNNFESKFNKDSLFIFDAASVDFFQIGRRKFKNIYFPEDGKKINVEVLFEKNELALLKFYEIEIIKGNVDPLMIKKKVDKYFIRESFYISKEENFTKVKLTKNSILNALKDKKDEVLDYVKKNNLSFKKERDLTRMFYFYSKK